MFSLPCFVGILFSCKCVAKLYCLCFFCRVIFTTLNWLNYCHRKLAVICNRYWILTYIWQILNLQWVIWKHGLKFIQACIVHFLLEDVCMSSVQQCQTTLPKRASQREHPKTLMKRKFLIIPGVIIFLATWNSDCLEYSIRRLVNLGHKFRSPWSTNNNLLSISW